MIQCSLCGLGGAFRGTHAGTCWWVLLASQVTLFQMHSPFLKGREPLWNVENTRRQSERTDGDTAVRSWPLASSTEVAANTVNAQAFPNVCTDTHVRVVVSA